MRLLLLALLILTLPSCGGSYSLVEMQNESRSIQESEGESNELEAVIAPYRNQLALEMSTVLCQSERAMVKARPESALGNFVSDLCLAKARELDDQPIDFALFNHGGLRTALPQGDITVGKVFELMPFENELVVVTLSKDKILEMMDYLIMRGGEPVAEIKLRAKGGELESIRIGEQELEDRDYRVVTSDYLANGGDEMTFLTEESRSDFKQLGLKIRDCIMMHCRQLGDEGATINTKSDGRIVIED